MAKSPETWIIDPAGVVRARVISAVTGREPERAAGRAPGRGAAGIVSRARERAGGPVRERRGWCSPWWPWWRWRSASSRTGDARTPEERIDAVAEDDQVPGVPGRERLREPQQRVAQPQGGDRPTGAGRPDRRRDPRRHRRPLRRQRAAGAPARRGIDALVWVLPVVVLVACAAGLVVVFRRWRREGRRRPADGGRPRARGRRAGRRSGRGIGSVTDLDRRTRLEDERRFLLTSLADLEREHEAGDIDDGDYQTLKDGYTPARPPCCGPSTKVAGPLTVTRRPDRLRPAAGRRTSALGRGRRRGHRSSACRRPLRRATAARSDDHRRYREDTNSRLAQARALLSTDPGRAFELYRRSSRSIRTTSEATTYVGWLARPPAASTGNAGAGRPSGAGCSTTPSPSIPDRADAHCFKAVVHFRFLDDPAAARQAVERCLALDPPADLADRGGRPGRRDRRRPRRPTRPRRRQRPERVMTRGARPEHAFPRSWHTLRLEQCLRHAGESPANRRTRGVADGRGVRRLGAVAGLRSSPMSDVPTPETPDSPATPLASAPETPDHLPRRRLGARDRPGHRRPRSPAASVAPASAPVAPPSPPG